MQYAEKTESYNERRYGRPWMAFVNNSLTKDFTFIEWDGRPGAAGEFTFDAEPGTLLAYGQKDIRKGRGGIDGYQICMPNGDLPGVSDARAAELRKMDLTARWRSVAEHKLLYAVTPPQGTGYERTKWEECCNSMAAKYSAMLGVPNPLMVDAAKAFGLIPETELEPAAAAASASVDLAAFGF